ncbi:MAG: MotA/TolQ/ExbB proton channel family protein [Pseudomonadota bacterium]
MASILGLLAASAIFFVALYYGTDKNYKVFWNPAGLAIVLGGTFAATMVCFPLNELFKASKVLLLIFKKETFKFADYIHEITSLAKQVREVKSYESIDMSHISDVFLKDGIQMLKDGIHNSDEIREIMETRVAYKKSRENAEAHIFLTMGKLAPAFGMVGTLIGLIDMLQKMGGQLDKLGAGMAVALITTFYGVVLANLCFLPIAEKLKRRTEEDVIFKMMIIEGIILLNEFQHPFVVEDRLNSYVPPKKRQDSTSLDGLHITLGDGSDDDDDKEAEEGEE